LQTWQSRDLGAGRIIRSFCTVREAKRLAPELHMSEPGQRDERVALRWPVPQGVVPPIRFAKPLSLYSPRHHQRPRTPGEIAAKRDRITLRRRQCRDRIGLRSPDLENYDTVPGQ